MIKKTSLAVLDDPKRALVWRSRAARDLAWMRLSAQGRGAEIARLRIGPVDALFAQGELCVEYQLAAEAMKPNGKLAMAAYGDSGPGVICAEAAYSEEKSEEVVFSRTSGGAEAAVMNAFRTLLKSREEWATPSTPRAGK